MVATTSYACEVASVSELWDIAEGPAEKTSQAAFMGVAGRPCSGDDAAVDFPSHRRDPGGSRETTILPSKKMLFDFRARVAQEEKPERVLRYPALKKYGPSAAPPLPKYRAVLDMDKVNDMIAQTTLETFSSPDVAGNLMMALAELGYSFKGQDFRSESCRVLDDDPH